MTEEQLKELSIFALRELARNAGVNSPTSKKKDVLIQEILDISNGKKQPTKNKTKQGRPPKSFVYSFANVFRNQDEFSHGFAFKQDGYVFNEQNNISVMGFVEILTSGSAFLWVNNGTNFVNYFIMPDLLAEFELKTGDKLHAEVGSAENDMIVKKILNINNVPCSKFFGVRKNYYDVEYKLPNKQIKFNNEFSNLNVKQGECNFLYGNNNNENSSVAINLLNSANTDYKIYINVSIAEKNKHFLSMLNGVEMFVTNITDDVEIAKRIVRIAIERAKRLFENGESVLVLIDDMVSVTSIDEQDLVLTKNLAALTKNSKDSSITTFAIMSNRTIDVIEKLADNRFKIENEKIIKL